VVVGWSVRFVVRWVVVWVCAKVFHLKVDSAKQHSVTFVCDISFSGGHESKDAVNNGTL
jgi:hypothetical protein